MIVAGDVGGTKTRLGIFEVRNDTEVLLASDRFVSADFKCVEDIVELFIESCRAKGIEGRPTAACLGIPGPVVNGEVKVTNLPWHITEQGLRDRFDLQRIKLVNDLVSTAAAVAALPPSALTTIYAGNSALPPEGISAVVAPGTGLGQAVIVAEAGKLSYLPTESGHANFAPATEEQIELWRFLRSKLNHVSVESVLCGPGLGRIFDFLADVKGMAVSEALAEELRTHDRGEVITRHGLGGEFDICDRALQLFVEILGAHCSNVVMNYLVTRGIYLGGGIPPRILKALESDHFTRGYYYKEKCLERVESCPIQVILDDRASLFGAARIAAML